MLRKLRNFIATGIISSTLTQKRGLDLFVAKVSQYLEADIVIVPRFFYLKKLRWNCEGRILRMKNIWFYLLVILFSVSCSRNLRVEKRRYIKGYYVEVKESNKAKNSSLSQSNDLNTDNYKSITESAYYTTSSIKPVLESNTMLLPEGLITSINKIDNNNPQIHVRVNIIDSNKTIKKANTLPLRSLLLNKITNKNKTKFNKFFKKNVSSGAFGFILGGVFLVAGTLVLLFASVLIGIILLVIGLIFMIVGAAVSSQNKSQSNENEVIYENIDVIYLKNGSMIRGVIMEMVIDDYVKIKMKDGSIYVYEMSEVDKITKEKASK